MLLGSSLSYVSHDKAAQFKRSGSDLEFCALFRALCFMLYDYVEIIKGGLMNSITANDLKRNGVTVIERVMSQSHESGVMINVRGKTKYVILSADKFN
jgi:hypothetical protein